MFGGNASLLPGDPFTTNFMELESERQRRKAAEAQLKRRPEPTAYEPELTPFSTGEEGERLRNLYWQRVTGDRPSVAQAQLKEGLGRQIAASRAAAASMPGVSPGLAMRLAGRQAGEAMGRTNLQAAMLRAGEQQTAERGLADWLLGEEKARAGFEMGREQMKAGQHSLVNQLLLQRYLAEEEMRMQRRTQNRGLIGSILGGVGGLIGLL